MRLAYADPPYLGQGHLYPEHPAARVWNDPAVHGRLIARLDEDYDGWAYSLSSTTLRELLPLAPEDVRVAAWVKPFSSWKPNQRVAYAWEPVLFRSARGRDRNWRHGDMPTIRDYVSAPVELKRGVIGPKPVTFCRWVLDLIGYADGDTVEDLFPGTGTMSRVVAQGVLL